MTDYSEGNGEDDDKDRTLHDGRDFDKGVGTQLMGTIPHAIALEAQGFCSRSTSIGTNSVWVQLQQTCRSTDQISTLTRTTLCSNLNSTSQLIRYIDTKLCKLWLNLWNVVCHPGFACGADFYGA